MKKRLGDLRLGEEFVTPLTNRPGTVLDWGHTRAFRHMAGPRSKLRTVMVQVGERELLMSPDALVEVGPDRINWTKREQPEDRWAKYLGGE